MHDGMVGLHEVISDGAEEVEHSISEKSFDDGPACDVDYVNISGSFRKTSLFILPRRPSSLGLTQIKRQTQAPIRK